MQACLALPWRVASEIRRAVVALWRRVVRDVVAMVRTARPERDEDDEDDDDGEEYFLGEWVIDEDGNLYESAPEPSEGPVKFEDPSWILDTPRNRLAVILFWARGWSGRQSPGQT